MDAFNINVDGKTLDYRVGNELSLDGIKKHFKKKYRVVSLKNGGRHVLGILEKNNSKFFLKLATSAGISAVTKIEHEWNQTFNNLVPRTGSRFLVPVNYECGEYRNLFYLITDYFREQPLVPEPRPNSPSDKIINNLLSIVELSEYIQKLNIENKNTDSVRLFLDKTHLWFNSIPKNVRENYQLNKALTFIKEKSTILEIKPRHGDFAPWHIIPLENHNLCLIDGEHFKAEGVENYDICYFIQRVYCVLNNSKLAKSIYTMLLKRGYYPQKLKPVLLARAIGGYLDESLKKKPDYNISFSFQKWSEAL